MRDDDVTEPLAEAAGELYAVDPAEFIRERGRLVKDAKESGNANLATAIGALRKPTVAAALINLTARSRPEAIAELLEIGAQLRTAQSRFDAARLTELRPARDHAISAVVEATEQVADEHDRRITPAARDEIHHTAVAALADQAAASAVSSGTLTRTLTYSGFGDVDLEEAVAYLPSGAVLRVIASPSEPDDVAAEPDDEGLDDGGLDDAEEELAKAERMLRDARKVADRSATRVERLKAQLAEAREHSDEASAAVTDAHRSRRQAQATVDRLRRARGR